jgi:membrane-bound serine protease (ClpP class)
METTFLTLGLFLLGVGVLLLLGELFLPSAGILLMLALSSVIVGLVFLFKYDTILGVSALLGIIAAVPFTGGVLLRFWSKQLRGDDEPIDEENLTVRDQNRLVGHFGKTLTPMRPAGMVDFAGQRVDCVTDGRMLEAGKSVRCVSVVGNRVVVRPADPAEATEMNEEETLNLN